MKNWRTRNGLSQSDVADLTGLSVAMVSRVESGSRRLAPLTKVAVARRLGCRVRDLFPVEPVEEPEAAP